MLGDSDPLGRVDIGGAEYGGVGTTRAPFGIGEGVGAEVEEEGHVLELPLEVESVGEGQNGKRRRLEGWR